MYTECTKQQLAPNMFLQTSNLNKTKTTKEFSQRRLLYINLTHTLISSWTTPPNSWIDSSELRSAMLLSLDWLANINKVLQVDIPGCDNSSNQISMTVGTSVGYVYKLK